MGKKILRALLLVDFNGRKLAREPFLCWRQLSLATPVEKNCREANCLLASILDIDSQEFFIIYYYLDQGHVFLVWLVFRMMSLRLMEKVNFQNCHHSNMYNMHKMNLSSGHSITHYYSKLIQPNIQSQGNLFFHFGTKYVRPVVCRIARTCVWNFQQMELAGFFNSICKRCLLRWSCQLLVKLLWHAVCIAETTVQFQTIKPFLKRFIAGINLRIW